MKFDQYRYMILQIIFCVAITACYYYPSLDNFFILDDFNVLAANSRGVEPAVFETSNMRLSSNLILWLIFQWFGLNHIGYNLFSITVHCINLTLVFLILRKLTDDERFSLIASVIFSGMSVYCDAILYKAAVATVLNVTFYSLVLLLYLKGKENVRFYYWSVPTFIFGMFIKEEIASLPIMILLIEILIFNCAGGLKSVLKKIGPYVVVVAAYIAASIIQSRYNNVIQYEFELASQFKVMRSLFGGFYSFFLRPDSVLADQYLLIYSLLLPVLFTFAIYVNTNRKILLLGFAWVIITFLPQSYSSNTALNVNFIAASMSRHLYLPSIGTAIVMASILLFSFRQLHKNRGNVIVLGAMVLLILYNGSLVHERSYGWGWNSATVKMKLFLWSLKAAMPRFEQGAHLLVDNPPSGRAEMSGALRAFWKNQVVYVDDLGHFNIDDIKILYLIENWPDNLKGITVTRLK